MAAAENAWNEEVVPRVFSIVSSSLLQRDLYPLLMVSPHCYRALLSVPSLWKSLDLHGMSKAGDRLMAALALPRYHHIKQINLEFAQDVEDAHLIFLKDKDTRMRMMIGGGLSVMNSTTLILFICSLCMQSLHELQSLNLNGCQKVSDKGIQAVALSCPSLRSLSIYWNVRLSDASIAFLTKNCKCIIDLNLSGCKNITDKGLLLIADNYKELQALNLTRCVKLTDAGLQQILAKCSSLRSLNLYALSSFTDNAYQKIGSLKYLASLDLCGAQNLSDSGLSCIAECGDLASLSLTWCVQVTDVGMLAIAKGCTSLEYLSLFGITGVTDKCLEALAESCSNNLITLDVNGCIGIKRRSRDDLRQLFPNLKCFKVHS